MFVLVIVIMMWVPRLGMLKVNEKRPLLAMLTGSSRLKPVEFFFKKYVIIPNTENIVELTE